MNILFIRGFGSALAVILTLMVTRYLETKAAADFLFLFNVTTVAAVCFRWGLDDVIVRRVATNGSRPVTLYIMRLAHGRVMTWLVAAFMLAGLLAVTDPSTDFRVGALSFTVAFAISGLVALTACAGRIYQGLGRTNLAAVVLNILVPGLLLTGLTVLLGLGAEVTSWRLQILYASVAAITYVAFVLFNLRAVSVSWLSMGPIRRSSEAKKDRSAANRLGGVVLSQQALNWSALLIIPVAYGDLQFNSFMVSYKVALLISLVMLAVNFTFAARLASYFAASKFRELKRLMRLMVFLVLSTSAVGAAAIFLGRDLVYATANVSGSQEVLAVLAASQVFFAIASVYALVLSMCHDEMYLLKLQGAIVSIGVSVFVVLCFSSSIEVAVVAFLLTYALLALALCRRAKRVTAA